MNSRPDPTSLQATQARRLQAESAQPRNGQADVQVMTPAGIQPLAEIAARRRFVTIANVVTWLAMVAALAWILSHGGLSAIDLVLIIAFACGTPWTVLGFWNATIGLWLLHGRSLGGGDALARVAPFTVAGDVPAALTQRTAVLMTLRNEDPVRALSRLKIVKAGLDATGEGHAFDYFVLSDSNDPDVAAREEAVMAEWRAGADRPEALIYRRRTDNAGFKAGNVRDFCERWGDRYTFMLPLDADSIMAGPAIVRLVRMMQAYPKLGIVQSLVVGAPSESAFARVFQFGMRQGMRSYTIGQAWWVADCGPFWGHNALVRIVPFRDACHLPLLPGAAPLGGAVMSHDQVEATLMRRAGYEVRVLPYEDGSFEENPPTMLEFARRDLRWCLGNLQYLKFFDRPLTAQSTLLPGLLPVSRFQLVWAILMFLGLPAFTLMIALSPFAVWDAMRTPEFPSGAAAALYLVFFTMYLMPKLAGFTDILLTPGAAARYGGLVRFVAAALVELLFSFLQGAVSSLRTTLFMLGLPFGRAAIGWNGQARDAHALSLSTAFAGLWPHLVFGLVICGGLFAVSPTALIWSLPLTAGYLLAIPFAMVTALPGAGRWMARLRLCAIPEEFAPPPEVQALMR